MADIKGDYRQFMDKNYFGSWDIDETELVVTIDHAEVNDVQNDRGSEKKLTVHLRGGYKPLIVNATNGDAISQVAGSTKTENWKGVSIVLYKERGKWFGKVGEAVRVRPYPPKVAITCEACGNPLKAAFNMSPNQLAAYTKDKYGRQLCADCAQKEADVNGTE